MAASRMIAIVLRAAPSVTLGLLVVWSILDVLSIPDPRRGFPLLGLAAAGVALLLLDAKFRARSTRTFGLVCIGAAYLIAHAVILGIDLVPALVFISVLIIQVELRVLAERFAPRLEVDPDRKSTRLNSSHLVISYAVFCLKKKKNTLHDSYYRILHII